MAEVTIKYKDQAIATMDASGTKTAKTEGKYLEADIQVVYDRPQGGGGLEAEPLEVTENGVYTAPSGKAYTPVTVNVPTVPKGTVIVTAPTGSTVTMTRGEDTRTAAESSGTWTFNSLDFGTWTITATKGTQTASKTVNVDSVTPQTIEIVYQVYHTDWEEKALIPTMTSDTTPKGRAFFTFNGTADTPAYYAFDGNDSTRAYGYANGTSINRGTSYNFENKVVVKSITAKYRPWSSTSITIHIDTSANNSEWTEHFTEVTTSTAMLTKDIDIKPTLSNYVRLVGSRNGTTGNADGSPEIFALQAIGYEIQADDISGLSEYGSTIDEILSNSDTLLANESAVDYMLSTCTGDFMWSAVSSQSFKIALYSTPYRDKIFDNEEWAKALRLVGYVKEQRLPVGYVELDSIEGTGTQWINTGYAFTSQDRKAEIGWLNTAELSHSHILGATSNGYNFNVYIEKNSSLGYYHTVYIGSSNYGNLIPCPINEWVDAQYELTNHKFTATYNGASTTAQSVATIPTSTASLYLFDCNSSSSFDKFKGKIKYTILTNDNAVARYFCPCRRLSDNQVGMYDLCESASPYDGTPFYGNSGSGVFIAGNPIDLSANTAYMLSLDEERTEAEAQLVNALYEMSLEVIENV